MTTNVTDISDPSNASSTDIARQPESPATLLTPSMNLPVYWLSIHSAFKQQPELAARPEDERQLQAENLRTLLKEVSEYPFDKWFQFCDLSGFTVEGFVTATWCKEVTWQQVMQFWQNTEKQVFTLSDPEIACLAQINPKFVPSPKLSSVLNTALNSSDLTNQKEPLHVSVLLLHALKGKFEVDYSAEAFADFDPDLRGVIAKYTT